MSDPSSAETQMTAQNGRIVALAGRDLTVELVSRQSRIALRLDKEQATLRVGDHVVLGLEMLTGGGSVLLEKNGQLYLGSTRPH